MSDIQIDRPHTLGLPTARQHARLWADKAQAKFGVECRYEEGGEHDVLHFSGNGIDGQLHVSADALQLRASLGFLAAMFKDQIEAKLRAQFDDMAAAA
ncbi:MULTISPECIES: polyhydroxyalkanoic acid system family protein [Comamonas]|uniref:polyhydroxyalkanoic acid system family protein n=1 Tax=Comamonas TaxID=283 RepID=UPI00235708AA|nr:polyhydroxyalkanoic acid system family protein [Comamonas terrigena]MDH0049937.1 polyhydroxyalkanoic acid system family protein [Comamonas terrigena]MDH0511115.1 polyhydroxyalkanoic acid system family protein [Comamonas terrigena]MDH1090717.1 polyhydroxyalkanoic acid system family protein [Comamonas terrigena]MDH1289826.1 polyhydroxyalkanoic acid system family protein [Comamonas terrigena]MDH1500234.1 polyhydroxyalkanoic acid system family protein [Comamonas terrigena]